MTTTPEAEERPAALRYLLAVLVCALTTVVSWPLPGHLDRANIVLLFTLAVVAIATWLGRGPAVLASFLAVACFDFFFVPPRFSMTVADLQYLITFGVMLVVTLLITHLTDAYRQKAREAEQRAAEAAFLHEMARELGGALTVEQVATRLAALCRRHLDISAWLFVPTPDERLQAIDNGITALGPDICRLAQGVYRDGQAGRVDASPAGVSLLLPLDGATRRRGVVALGLSRPQARREALWVALAAVVATAVERIHFVDVAQSTTLDMQTERLRSSILAAIAHDLRTPLTVLYGLADALASAGNLEEEQQITAVTLRDHSHRMHRTVDNLLDMARLRSGHLELRRDWQSIVDLVGASVQALSPWLEAERLAFHWPPDLPLVKVDAVLMQRVFCNLLENAAKYSPAGTSIVVGASVDDDQAHVRIWFDNTGDGFPADDAGRVFELFERGARTATTAGMGVGLAVCRAIVEAHGGRIEALNRVDGARVQIELALTPAPAIAPEPGT